MYIELKEIDKDTLKVGDWVGVAKKVSCGWGSSFRHQLIIPAKIQELQNNRTNCRAEIRTLRNYKTAFDVEKVIEQLNELLEEKTSDSGEDWYTAECLAKAIEIVKRGGRDEE